MEMTFNLTGFGLAIICLSIVALQIVTHKFVKKVTNTYWWWLAFGSFCFIWLVYFRFAGAWHNFASQIGKLDGTDYYDANVISKALLLDVCPFMGLFMCFSVIVDPTRKLARAAAPLALIGGLLIICIEMPFEGPGNDTYPLWDLHWIFCGGKTNPCYFFLHAINIFFAVGVMLNTPSYGWKGYLATVLLAGLYYSYVAICMGVFNCRYFVSGLSIRDWDEGEYSPVRTILNCSPEVACGLGFTAGILVCSGFIALKDYVFNKGWFKYGNAYSHKWYSWYNYQRFVTQKII